MSVNFVNQSDDKVKINHVLASVSDKRGLDTLVPALVETNPDVKIFSTGGTWKKIDEILGSAADAHLVRVADYTGQPEMQGGLVKTLDFKIYLGLLSETYNESHAGDLQRMDAVAIDMVIVNLYPFKETIAATDVTPEKARANIDIGGPCMVRASAKNFLRVASVTDPADYPQLIEKLRSTGGTLEMADRFELSKKAFAHTAAYDAAISQYFADRTMSEITGCYEFMNGA